MPARARILRAIDRYFEVQLGLAMGALIVMMLVIVVDVAMRYVLNSPIRGSYDIVEICLTVSVFFSIASVIAHRHEIVIDLIDGIAPTRAVRALVTLAQAAGIAVLAFIFWSMLRPTRDAYRFGDVKLELDLPVWWIWALALVGLFSGILAAASTLLRDPQEPPPGDLAATIE